MIGWVFLLLVSIGISRKDKIIVGLDCPECEFSTHEILSYRKHVHGHKATLETGHEMNFSCSKCKEK